MVHDCAFDSPPLVGRGQDAALIRPYMHEWQDWETLALMSGKGSGTLPGFSELRPSFSSSTPSGITKHEV